MAPDAVLSGGRVQGGRSLGRRVATTGLALVVLGLAAWLVVGLAFAVLHLIELAVVAVAAAYLGYRVGVARGRRHR